MARPNQRHMEPGQPHHPQPPRVPKTQGDTSWQHLQHPSKQEKEGGPRWGVHGQRVRVPENNSKWAVNLTRGQPPWYELRTKKDLHLREGQKHPAGSGDHVPGMKAQQAPDPALHTYTHTDPLLIHPLSSTH